MVIVDTTAWVGYLRGTRNPETEWLDQEVGREEIELTDLILCEVLQGVRSEEEYGRVRMLLGEFELYEAGGGTLRCRRGQLPEVARPRPCSAENH